VKVIAALQSAEKHICLAQGNKVRSRHAWRRSATGWSI
jgi:hypothetical protein